MSKGLGKIEKLVIQCLTDSVTQLRDEDQDEDIYEIEQSKLVNRLKQQGISEPSIRRAIKSLARKKELFIYYCLADDGLSKVLFVGFAEPLPDQEYSDVFEPEEWFSCRFNYEQNVINTLIQNGGKCKQSLLSQHLTSQGYERDPRFGKGNERAVNKLLKKGIIKRFKSEEDKRTYMIELSQTYIEENQIKILPPMTEEELEQAKAVVREREERAAEALIKAFERGWLEAKALSQAQD